MYNTFHKIKYIILIALLPAILISLLPANIGVFKNAERRDDISADVSMGFDSRGMSDAVVSGAFAEFLGRYTQFVRLKNFGGCTGGLKTAAAVKYKFDFNQNNIYTPVRIPYYAEICMILSLIVITFIFLTDGKKRSKFIIHIS